ncbi:hypothetical protein DFH08DRAFT_809688 [Mycena albidolilacea]|uniref:Uncharacterized protein n=1 Tax=Mycena albidolilacea TaxID=1033008 RepID=A0AAD7A095_9AGAR|nr:hypothetical protein DFH08DRAFT_809688 [Mycena albidolilacea]
MPPENGMASVLSDLPRELVDKIAREFRHDGLRRWRWSPTGRGSGCATTTDLRAVLAKDWGADAGEGPLEVLAAGREVEREAASEGGSWISRGKRGTNIRSGRLALLQRLDGREEAEMKKNGKKKARTKGDEGGGGKEEVDGDGRLGSGRSANGNANTEAENNFVQGEGTEAQLESQAAHSKYPEPEARETTLDCGECPYRELSAHTSSADVVRMRRRGIRVEASTGTAGCDQSISAGFSLEFVQENMFSGERPKAERKKPAQQTVTARA